MWVDPRWIFIVCHLQLMTYTCQHGQQTLRIGCIHLAVYQNLKDSSALCPWTLMKSLSLRWLYTCLGIYDIVIGAFHMTVYVQILAIGQYLKSEIEISTNFSS